MAAPIPAPMRREEARLVAISAPAPRIAPPSPDHFFWMPSMPTCVSAMRAVTAASSLRSAALPGFRERSASRRTFCFCRSAMVPPRRVMAMRSLSMPKRRSAKPAPEKALVSLSWSLIVATCSRTSRAASRDLKPTLLMASPAFALEVARTSWAAAACRAAPIVSAEPPAMPPGLAVPWTIPFALLRSASSWDRSARRLTYTCPAEVPALLPLLAIVLVLLLCYGEWYQGAVLLPRQSVVRPVPGVKGLGQFARAAVEHLAHLKLELGHAVKPRLQLHRETCRRPRRPPRQE